MSNIFIDIGGFNFELKSSDHKFIKSLEELYENFLAPASNHPFVINLAHTKELKPIGNVMFSGGGGVFKIDGDHFNCKLNLSTKETTVDIANDAGSFNSFFRVFLSYFLLYHEGFLMHSLGLELGGYSYLFAGPSDAGKTTTANLAKGFKVMGDELMIVRKMLNKFYTFSTPFLGEYKGRVSNISAPLKRVLFLDKKLTKDYSQRSRSDIISRVLDSVFFFQQSGANKKLLKLICDFSSHIEAGDINILKCNNLKGFIHELT